MNSTALRLLFVLAGAAALPAQYNLVVTNFGDSGSTGAGTLREGLLYLQANAPATATITLAVSGTLTLTQPLPYFNATTKLTLQHSFPSGRFTIDARPVSNGGPIHGLQVPGANAVISAPLTILINNGVGLEIANSGSRVDDVEVQGASQVGFNATGATNLVAKRISVTGSGGAGVFVTNNTTNARFGDAAAGLMTFVRGRQAPGIQIQGGSGIRFEAFDVALCPTGVFASGTSGLVLGNLTGPRSNASDCTGTGVFLQNVIGSSGVRTLQRADLKRNTLGAQVEGGSVVTIADCACDANASRGVGADLGAANLLLDTLVCSNTGNGSGLGIYVGNVATATVRNCTMGPNNKNGFDTFGGGINTGLRVEGGSASNNLAFGARLEQVRGLVIDGLTANSNIAAGVFGIGLDALRLTSSILRGNLGEGLNLAACTAPVIGPGNVVEDNGSAGLWLDTCGDAIVTGNPSISRNRFMGVYLLSSPRSTVKNCTLLANNAIGVSVLSSDDCVVGPGNVITATTGTGIKIELCRSGVVESCRITKCQGTAISYIGGSGTPAVRSTLVAENRDIGINLRSTPATDIVCCTIVANYRGVYPNGSYQSGSTQARVKSCILRRQVLDDYGTFDPFGVVLPSYSFLQNPPGTGNNSAADPLFAQEAAGDWRLKPTSPAIDACDPALTWSFGAVDAYGGARVFGARADCGAWERQPTTQVLTFFPDAMPPPGAKIDFTLQWPGSEAGRVSILLFNLAGPGSFPLFGLNIPLALDQWMTTSLSISAPLHVNTVVFSIPGGGTVNGSIDYSGLPLLTPYYPLRIWACGFVLNLPNNQGTQLSNVSWFEIR